MIISNAPDLFRNVSRAPGAFFRVSLTCPNEKRWRKNTTIGVSETCPRVFGERVSVSGKYLTPMIQLEMEKRKRKAPIPTWPHNAGPELRHKRPLDRHPKSVQIRILK